MASSSSSAAAASLVADPWRASLVAFRAAIFEAHKQDRAQYDADYGSGAAAIQPLLRDVDPLSGAWLPSDVTATAFPARGYILTDTWPQATSGAAATATATAPRVDRAEASSSEPPPVIKHYNMQGMTQGEFAALSFVDRLLMMFLLSRGFHRDTALKRFTGFRKMCIENEFVWSLAHPDVQAGLSLALLVIAHPTPKTDADGCPVFSMIPRRLDWSKVTDSQMRRAWFIAALYICHVTPMAQLRGITMIGSLIGIGMTNLSMSFQRFSVTALQGCMPVKIKAVYMYEPPWIMRTIFPILKSLMSTKLQQRLHIGVEASTLLAKLPADCIPDEIPGGTRDVGSAAFLANPLQQFTVAA